MDISSNNVEHKIKQEFDDGLTNINRLHPDIMNNREYIQLLYERYLHYKNETEILNDSLEKERNTNKLLYQSLDFYKDFYMKHLHK